MTAACEVVDGGQITEDLYLLAGILHEARMKECYGNWAMTCRVRWPATFKEFREQQQAGQSWIDIGLATARAAYPLLCATTEELRGIFGKVRFKK